MAPAHYQKSEVADSINEFISDVGAKILIDKHTGNSTISTGKHLIIMNNGLFAFLGFHYTLKRSKIRVFRQRMRFSSQRIVDERQGFDTMFIHCDVVEPRIVGDTSASLLVTLPNSNK